MNTQRAISLASLPPVSLSPRAFLIVIQDREPDGVIELIARLALHGPFHLIPGGEWLPNQVSMRRAVRRYTVAVDETLDHPILARPFTCLQFLDLLQEAESQNSPTLILDFLHHFHNPDVDFSLRQRVLEDCCRQVQHLARSTPLLILVQELPVEEYREFFPMLAVVADEIFEVQEDPAL